MKNIYKHLKKQSSGAMMVEVLMVVGLILLLTPLIYSRVSYYTGELEDGGVADNLRSLSQGVYSYIEKNYDGLADGSAMIKSNSATTAPIGALADGADAVDYHIVDIDDPELETFINTNDYKTKFFDNAIVALKRHRLNNNKIVITAMLATDSVNDVAITATNGARVASLYGAGAGYTKTSEDGGTTKLTALGAGGFFKQEVDEYFSENMPNAGQIVVNVGSYPKSITAVEQAQAEGEFLFRGDILPPNSYKTPYMMETDIDFEKYASGAPTGEGYSVESVGEIFGKRFEPSTDPAHPNYIDDTLGGKQEGLIAELEKYHTYKDDESSAEFITYGVNFEDKSAFLDDARVETLGGAKISEVLPNLILMDIYQDIDMGHYVPLPGYDNPKILKPNAGCPIGYEPKFELVQKEAASGVDLLALAEHPSSTTGIHSTKTWLRNNKLVRSSHKYNDGSTTKTFYKSYDADGNTTAQCYETGGDYVCTTFEVVGGEQKISQKCSSTRTIYYDVNDGDNEVTDANINNLTLSGVGMHADYDTTAGFWVFSSPSTNRSNAVLTCNTSGNCSCSNNSYCPDFDATKNYGTAPVLQYVQHGACQALINTIEAGNFLPYGSGYTEVDADGTSGSTNRTTSATTTGISFSGGYYYNTRLYYKAATSGTNITCSNGTSTLYGTNGLCASKGDAADSKRYSSFRVKHDLYYYCAKKQ